MSSSTFSLSSRRCLHHHHKTGILSIYLQRLDFVLESPVLRLQVLHAALGLAQLSLQLGLQLPAPLLELQQLLPGLLAAAQRHGRERRPVRGDRRRSAGTQLSLMFICISSAVSHRSCDPDNAPQTATRQNRADSIRTSKRKHFNIILLADVHLHHRARVTFYDTQRSAGYDFYSSSSCVCCICILAGPCVTIYFYMIEFFKLHSRLQVFF